KALFLDRPRQPGDPVERLPLHLGRPTQNIDDMHSHRPGSPSAAPLIAGGTLAEPIATVAPRERYPALPRPRGQPSNFPLDKTGFREYKSGTLKQSGLLSARCYAAVSSAVAAATATRIIPAAITNQTSRATGRLPPELPLAFTIAALMLLQC